MCKNIIGQFLHAVYHTNRTGCLQFTFRRKSHGISQTRNVKYSCDLSKFSHIHKHETRPADMLPGGYSMFDCLMQPRLKAGRMSILLT